MLSTLEVLRRTEAQLVDPYQEYRYSDWTQCTCGHIYQAVTGKQASHNIDVQEPRGVYADVMKAVFDELGLVDIDGHANALSRYTVVVGSRDHVDRRHAALVIVREAIAKIEARERANMLKVIDEHNFALAK